MQIQIERVKKLKEVNKMLTEVYQESLNANSDAFINYMSFFLVELIENFAEILAVVDVDDKIDYEVLFNCIFEDGKAKE